MSNTDHGNKTSIQRDALSYFQKPQSKNPHSLHASSSFEKLIIERDFNPCENAFNIHIMDEILGSSSDQSAINAFSLEIGNKNIEFFSSEDDMIHSRKRKKANGT
jgi:hypothetical protein